MLNAVSCGKWTLNDGKLSYHQTTLSDFSAIHTFSSDPSKKHELALPVSSTLEGDLD